MSGYPDYPRRQTIRVGVAVTLVVGVVAVFGILRGCMRPDGWEFTPPIEPKATGPAVHEMSRWLHWRSWRYTTLSPPAAVQRFYDGVLPGDGWARKAAATNAVMWRRDELALAVQAEVRDGATQVLLLLTPARRER